MVGIPQNLIKMLLTRKTFWPSKSGKKNLSKKSHCVTCHGSMNVGIYKASVIGETCVVCHNEEVKNTPEVAKIAEEILHNINISRAYRNWVTLYFSEKRPEQVKEINTQYDDIVISWHTFNFERINEKSQKLLGDLKAIVKKEVAEKKRRMKNK
jgi:pterin-4a-carbinolamine dehydratase